LEAFDVEGYQAIISSKGKQGYTQNGPQWGVVYDWVYIGLPPYCTVLENRNRNASGGPCAMLLV